MEALILLLLAVVLYGHSWDLLGATRSKSTAGVAAGTGVTLLLAALFSPGGLAGGGANTVVASLTILWGIYALVAGALGFWELEGRALGLYALPVTAVSLLLGWKLLSTPGQVQPALFLGAAAVISAIAFALLFIYAGLQAARLERVYGYIQLIISVIIGALAVAAYLA